jgi:hypothetical protein
MLAAEPLSRNPPRRRLHHQDARPPSSLARSSPSRPARAHLEPGRLGTSHRRSSCSLASPSRDGTAARTTQLCRTRASRGAPPPARKRAPTKPPRRGERRSATAGAAQASPGDLCRRQRWGGARRRRRPPVGWVGPVALGGGGGREGRGCFILPTFEQSTRSDEGPADYKRLGQPSLSEAT